MKRTLLLAGLLCFSFGFGQNRERLKELQNDTKVQVSFNELTRLPSFLKFKPTEALSFGSVDAQANAQQFVAKYYDLYGVEKASDLVFHEMFVDNYGFKHIIYKQYYKGVEVFDGLLKFNFNKEGAITSVSGNLQKISKLSAVAALDFQAAESKARIAIDEQKLNASGLALEVEHHKLVVFPKGLVQGGNVIPYLAYEIELTNKNDVRETVFIDAHTGLVVDQFTGIHPIDRKLYETSISTANLKWSEGNALPGTLDQWQQNEVQAAGHTYNFFKNAFGYVSYNGNDRSMITINNNPNINCPNANWNGQSANYCTGTAADDVVAHEWGHAYTSYTSGLIYQYQSGALNESYSDVWGETIDLINGYQDETENMSVRTGTACNVTSTRWKMGEDATAFGSHIRDLWNPNCRGDPGSVLDSSYYHCASSDSGGVHVNSGVPNHLYALLVDGGTYNGYTINAIGFVKAAHIWWRAQRNYLTSTSNFAAFANALQASCTDLIGINLQGLSTSEVPAGLSGQIITAMDLANLQNAILAVQLTESVNTQCNFVPVLYSDTPALCTGATTGALFSETWENGLGAWTVSNAPVNSSWINRNWTVRASLPKGRAGRAAFGTDPVNGNCSSSMQNGIIRLESPTITFPVFTTGKYEMAFTHYVATESKYDGGNIKYSLDNGATWTLVPASAFTQNPYNLILDNTSNNDNPMKGQPAFSGIDGGSLEGSWGQSIVDLSLLGVTSGSTIKFRFEMGTDGCNGDDGWYIDELYIYNCNNLLSVTDITKNTGFNIYPNPTTGLLNIENQNNLVLKTAEIYGATGQLIKTFDISKKVKQQSLDLTELSSGTYMLKVKTDQGVNTVKVVKK